MGEYVYILREDMYHEWAWENGATNLISVSHNLDTILEDMKRYLIIEKEEDSRRIIGENLENQNIDNIIQNAEFELEKASIYSINIYINEEGYNNGKESGCLVIENMEVK